MKGAIASIEIFGMRSEEPIRRFTLTLSAPSRREESAGPAQEEWECRVALADRHRPHSLVGRDSVCVLADALDLARTWLADLRGQGFALYRDRAGETPFDHL